MQNKGFTLIELVASIVILAILALLAFPAILNVLNKGNEKVDESIKQTLISSAEEYVNNNINDFPKPIAGEEDITKTIDISLLNQEGYIESMFYDKYCEIKNDSITVIAKQNKYEYQYNVNEYDEACEK